MGYQCDEIELPRDWTDVLEDDINVMVRFKRYQGEPPFIRNGPDFEGWEYELIHFRSSGPQLQRLVCGAKPILLPKTHDPSQRPKAVVSFVWRNNYTGCILTGVEFDLSHFKIMSPPSNVERNRHLTHSFEFPRITLQ